MENNVPQNISLEFAKGTFSKNFVGANIRMF